MSCFRTRMCNISSSGGATGWCVVLVMVAFHLPSLITGKFVEYAIIYMFIAAVAAVVGGLIGIAKSTGHEVHTPVPGRRKMWNDFI